MKVFRWFPHPQVVLAGLLTIVFVGATLLPMQAAETKSKKSGSKSSASSTPRKKKSSTTPKPKSKASPTTKSTPKKEAATPAPKKKKTSDSSSSSAKAAPSPKPKAEDAEPPASTSKSKATPAPQSKESESKASDSGKPGVPGQPAPELPVRDPESGSTPPADGSKSATPDAASGAEPTASTKPLPNPVPEAAATSPEAGKAMIASIVSLSPEDILGFDEQPPKVKELIQAALSLTEQKLTYTYGSADPSKGGMDCSGAIHYLLGKQGFDDVPRDASGQYVWARKNGKFFAVVSKKADSFEFGDLLPGDLLFWNGTYNVDRDPPVTHTMIYLGVQRKRAQHVMWGSSDGRTYDGKPRRGVSVFDFKMPRADKNILEGAKADFLGYARIPGLRE